jgi:hypothetical protein
MVGTLVNQAKREVEDAYPWLALYGEVQISTTADVAAYSLTGMGQRAKIQRVHNKDTDREIRSVDWYQVTRDQDFTASASDEPSYWRLNGVSLGDPVIEFNPTPNAIYNISVYGVVPQDELSAGTDVLTIPYYPVILNAYLLALVERGDDRGVPYDHAQREYQSALADAVAIDSQNNRYGHASDWVIQ